MRLASGQELAGRHAALEARHRQGRFVVEGRGGGRGWRRRVRGVRAGRDGRIAVLARLCGAAEGEGGRQVDGVGGFNFGEGFGPAVLLIVEDGLADRLAAADLRRRRMPGVVRRSVVFGARSVLALAVLVMSVLLVSGRIARRSSK